MLGETLAMYPVGITAAGMYWTSSGTPKIVRGPVQAKKSATSELKIAGIFVQLKFCWKPITLAEVDQLSFGDNLFGAVAVASGGAYPGEVVYGSYGGKRITDKSRLVLGVWTTMNRREAIPDMEKNGKDYRRIHVENIAIIKD